MTVQKETGSGQTTAAKSQYAVRRLNRKLRLGEQSGWLCVYCGDRIWPHTITEDHIVPRIAAGSRIQDNKIASCPRCNVSKGHKRTMTFAPASRPVERINV